MCGSRVSDHWIWAFLKAWIQSKRFAQAASGSGDD